MMVFSIFAFAPVESEGSPKWPVVNAYQWGIIKISKYLNKKVIFNIIIRAVKVNALTHAINLKKLVR